MYIFRNKENLMYKVILKTKNEIIFFSVSSGEVNHSVST